MIKRFCDICGEELGKNYHSVNLPRIVRCKIRGGYENITLKTFDMLDYVDTDIFSKCEYKLATALPVVEE